MKRVLFFLLLITSLHTIAQEGVYYSAARNGLSLREQPTASSKLLTKIPYGEKIIIKQPSGEALEYKAEGLSGYWVATTYNGKAGYIVDNYLLPTPPPKAGVSNLQQYLEQISTAAGAPVETKQRLAEMDDATMSLKKQLYKNGAEYHLETGYESHTYSFFLPQFTLQQVFVLLRSLPEYKTAFDSNDAFPSANTTIKRGEKEIKVKVVKEDYDSGIDRVVRFHLSYEEGALYDIEVFELGSQVIVTINSGV
jgi:hypothetical protein